MGETPFSLSFGVEALVLVEIGLPVTRIEQFNPQESEISMRLSLDLLKEEHREATCLRIVKYKHRIGRYYNTTVRVRSFKKEDMVLRKVMQNT